MKIVRYSPLSLTLIALASMHLAAMEQKQDATKMIELRCWHLDESITVPAHIIKHSITLSDYFEKSIFVSFYPIPVDVFDQKTLQGVVDCLKIIDSETDVKNSLLDYMLIKYTPEERINLFDASESLKILLLMDVSENFPDYCEQKASELRDALLEVLIEDAEKVFEKIEDKANSAIIFDVDDTALRCIKSPGMVHVNGIRTCFPYYPALEKVLTHYKKVGTMGFKIFFLTARVEKILSGLILLDHYEATVQNLKNEGYDVFEQVICVPYDARSQMQKQANGDNELFVKLHAQWKESERNKIAEKFKIVGTLDDIEKNLQGENVGHAILIPKFH